MQPPSTGVTYFAVKVPTEHFTLCEGGSIDKIGLCIPILSDPQYNECDSSVDSTQHFTYPSVDCASNAPGVVCEYFDVSAFVLQEFKVMIRIYMVAPDGISYPQDLYKEVHLMEIKTKCGLETLSIVPAYKDSYQINSFDVSKVIERT